MRGADQRRSGRPGLWNIAAVVVSLGLGLAAGADSLANFWRVSDPDRTLQLRPDDAVSLTTQEDRLRAYEDPTVADVPVMAMIARTALRAEPLTPVALRQLAVAQLIAGRQALADRLIDLAHRISRREIGTTWLLVNRSLNRGDAAGVVQSFDEALTTSPAAPDIMFPALSEGLNDGGIRSALVPYIRSGRPWMGAFLRYAASLPNSASNTAITILAADGLPNTPRSSETDASVLAGLAARHDFSLAERFLREAVKLPVTFFSDVSVDPLSLDSRTGPFGWRFYNGPDGGGFSGDGNAIILRAEPDRRVLSSSRMLLLKPGVYTFKLRGIVRGGQVPALAEVAMVCINYPQNFVIFGAKSLGSGVVKLPFSVPKECGAQRIDIVVVNKAIDAAAELRISELQISHNGLPM